MTRFIAFIMVGLFMSACYDFSLKDPKDTSGTDGADEGGTGGVKGVGSTSRTQPGADASDDAAKEIGCPEDNPVDCGAYCCPTQYPKCGGCGFDCCTEEISETGGSGGAGGTRGVSGAGGSGGSSDAGETGGSIETGGAGGGEAVFDAAVDGNVGDPVTPCPVDRPADGDACNGELLCGYDGSICTCEASMWRCTIECPPTPPNTLEPCLPTWPISCEYADRSCGCLTFIWSCKDNDGETIW